MKSTRLYFIDAVRAFAILMMLQGHFISSVLDPVFRDPNNMVYSVWLYFRGNTAPMFFTISGLIFTYLLLKANDKGNDNPRIKKGIRRGVELIIIGYLIRIPFLAWFGGYFDTYFLVIDVLQCIGLSLILLVLLYVLAQKNRQILSFLYLALGCVIFVTEPLYRTLTLDHTPEFFANYISKQYGSVFTMLPWFGFMAFGGFIATLFYKYADKAKFKLTSIILFIISGAVLMFLSTPILKLLHEITGVELFLKSANYNYLFLRLGNVLVAFGIFYALERFLKHSLITKIGAKTLAIYVVHFIILYGSAIGFGLSYLYANILNPWQAAIGAMLFLIGTCVIVLNLGRVQNLFLQWNGKLIKMVKR
ncbi:heparan-alpha-glucosaminide N-acetyltransferase domain-containing protein [Flavobacteriaceae bacterium LMO-SS05]